jgi:hypothetical protein
VGAYTGPEIVNTGLVLVLDAGNTKSYPGSGTTWTDRSTVGNTGTLTNGPTYSSANGGAIVFDGLTQYVNFGSTYTGLDLIDKSIQCWVKKTGASAKGIVDKDFDNGAPNYGGWGFWIQANNKLWWWPHPNLDLLDDGALTVSNTTWTNVAATWNASTKTANFYINATLNSTKTNASIVEKASGSANLVVGAYRNTSNTFDGSIAAVKAYNRVLTAAEISQNFNALRGRFGI